jgi:hypothetical protein
MTVAFPILTGMLMPLIMTLPMALGCTLLK